MRLLLFEEFKGWVSGTSQTCPPTKRMENFCKVREKKHAANHYLADFKMVATYFCREKGLSFLFHFTPLSQIVGFGEEKTPDLGGIPWL